MFTNLLPRRCFHSISLLHSSLYGIWCQAARAKAGEEKFVKLREVYQKLRSEHIVLLRTNGETLKQVHAIEKDKLTVEDEAKVSVIQCYLM